MNELYGKIVGLDLISDQNNDGKCPLKGTLQAEDAKFYYFHELYETISKECTDFLMNVWHQNGQKKIDSRDGSIPDVLGDRIFSFSPEHIKKRYNNGMQKTVYYANDIKLLPENFRLVGEAKPIPANVQPLQDATLSPADASEDFTNNRTGIIELPPSDKGPGRIIALDNGDRLVFSIDEIKDQNVIGLLDEKELWTTQTVILDSVLRRNKEWIHTIEMHAVNIRCGKKLDKPQSDFTGEKQKHKYGIIEKSYLTSKGSKKSSGTILSIGSAGKVLFSSTGIKSDAHGEMVALLHNERNWERQTVVYNYNKETCWSSNVALGETVDFPDNEAYWAYFDSNKKATEAKEKGDPNAAALFYDALEKAISAKRKQGVEHSVLEIIKLCLYPEMMPQERDKKCLEMEKLLKSYEGYFRPVQYIEALTKICKEQDNFEILISYLQGKFSDNTIDTKFRQLCRSEFIFWFPEMPDIDPDEAIQVTNQWITDAKEFGYFGHFGIREKNPSERVPVLKKVIPYIVLKKQKDANWELPEGLRLEIDNTPIVKTALNEAFSNEFNLWHDRAKGEKDPELAGFYFVEALKAYPSVFSDKKWTEEIITRMLLPFFCKSFEESKQNQNISFDDLKRISDENPLSPENAEKLTIFLFYYLNAIRDNESNRIERITEALSNSANGQLIMDYAGAIIKDKIAVTETTLIKILDKAKDVYTPVGENRYATKARKGALEDETMVFGRMEMIEEIKSLHIQEHSGIVLHGLRRAGKSTIKHHLIKKIEKDNGQNSEKTIIVELDAKVMSDNIALDFPNKVRSNVGYALENEFTKNELEDADIIVPKGTASQADKAQSELTDYLDKVKNFLKLNPRGIKWKIALFVDEFTSIYQKIPDKNELKQFMDYIRGMIENYPLTGVFVGQEYTLDFISVCGNQFAHMEQKKVDYLARGDSEKMIREPSGLVFIEGAVDRICELTANSPFYNMFFMDALVTYMNDKRNKYVTIPDINNLLMDKDYIDKLPKRDDFESLYGDEFGEDKVSSNDNIAVLRYIAKTGNSCSRNDITVDEIEINADRIGSIVQKLRSRDVLVEHEEEKLSIKVGLFSEWLRNCEPSKAYIDYETAIANKSKKDDDLPQTGEKITTLIDTINQANKGKRNDIIFDSGDKDRTLYMNLIQDCHSEDIFGKFITSVYDIIFLRTQGKAGDNKYNSLARLPQAYRRKDFVKYVHTLRLRYGHPAADIRPGQLSLETVYRTILGTSNPPQTGKDFQQLQKKILEMFITFLENLNAHILNYPETKQAGGPDLAEKKSPPKIVAASLSPLDNTQQYKAVLTGKTKKKKWKIKLIDFSDWEGFIKNTENVPVEKEEGNEIRVRWIGSKPPVAEFEYINEMNDTPKMS